MVTFSIDSFLLIIRGTLTPLCRSVIFPVPPFNCTAGGAILFSMNSAGPKGNGTNH
nr:MAG TPA: hypothetical protein [Caudoviricetes sp.]